MDNRLGDYKKAGISADSLRRSRVESGVTLRKEKRDEVMAKRRNIQPVEDSNYHGKADDRVSSAGAFPGLIAQTRSDTVTVKREAVEGIRKVLSGEANPPIDDMIRAGAVPALIQCVDHDDPGVRFEACWALTNIAGGEPHQTAAVVEAGAVPRFIKLLGSSDTGLCDQAVWALGNIAGDGVDLRDYCLDSGIAEPLMKLVATPSLPPSLIRNVSWLIVNLCRWKSLSPSVVVNSLLPPVRFLLDYPDTRVVRDAMWALAYLTEGGDDVVQRVIELGMVRVILHWLGHTDVGTQTAAIRVVGNIATGTDEQTQFLLDAGVLKLMPALLTHNKPKITREAAWLCSNVAVGDEQQVQAVIDANLVPYIIRLLEGGYAPTRKEAAWTIANITCTGTAQQTACLVDHNVIPALCNMLEATHSDSAILLVLLDAIHNILRKMGDREKEVCDKIEECGGLSTIEELEHHDSEHVYRKAYEIIVEYFSQLDDEDGGDFWTTQGDGGKKQRPKDEQMDVPEGGFSFD